MFSVRSFTCQAVSAMRLTASGLNSTRTLSVARSASYCLVRQASVLCVQDLLEVGNRQGVELDPDGETALQFGNQVGGLGEVERPAADEQDVIGLDHAVLGRHRGALDQRQQIALHALAGRVGPGGFRAACDLVDLVQEDDAILLDVAQCPRLQVFVIDQARSLLLA